MTVKVKSVLSAVSDALEAAAGYALVAVGLYAALFIDITGGGSLWKMASHIRDTSREGVESPNATRIIKVPVRPDVEKLPEDRFLAVFDDSTPGTVSAPYQAPEALAPRPSAPADPKPDETWKRGLKGELRRVSVYGDGEETSSASLSAGAAVRAEPVAEPAVVAAEGSAARAETAAAARPGTGSRLSRGALSASDTSRNVR
ncbi:MAG: hypothetical protein HY403_06915 [Elusimicrobia bacterium]|nr:hypothetical protein [Elusimicrobiota bacterium]